MNGSDGYWVNQPQITLVNTQTEILDWSGNGDLGRQNNFSNDPSSVNQGILDAPLDPNSLTDAYWDLPTGIIIDDLIIEALRPVDPKVSFSPIEITIHDTAVNPVDGSLFMLVNEDLIRLDNNSIKHIIDIESEIYGRTLVVDDKNKQLIIEVTIFNIKGKEIFKLYEGYQSIGKYSLLWNGVDFNQKAVPSGIYFLKMKTKNNSQIRKMILTK